MPGNASRRYLFELRVRVVWVYHESWADHQMVWVAMVRVAELLGIGSPETVCMWVRRDEIDAGSRPGVTLEESAEVERLKRENAGVCRANAIVKAASVFFVAELDRSGQ